MQSRAVTVEVEARRVPVAESADATEAYLTRWGQWLRHGGGDGLGFPSETLVGRFMREGAVIRAGRGGGRAMEDDPIAERVDRIVARLAMDDRRWPLMLRVCYGVEESTPGMIAGVLEEHYGRVSAASVRGWLREAVATVRGELRGMGLV